MYGPSNSLIGRTITQIQMDSDHLLFSTDAGPIAFEVEGDCCSSSYFYDFLGVEKLLNNGPVVSFRVLALSDEGAEPRTDECVSVYGYELVTIDPRFGEVTSVFTFRNDSNGYYGGWMQDARPDESWDSVPTITSDLLETS